MCKTSQLVRAFASSQDNRSPIYGLIIGTGALAKMSTDRPLASLENDSQRKHAGEFEHWRVAAGLVERMREAGIECKLWIDAKDRH